LGLRHFQSVLVEVDGNGELCAKVQPSLKCHAPARCDSGPPRVIYLIQSFRRSEVKSVNGVPLSRP
jgi:hypothetical protein